jgi:hypothetical protein
MDPERIIHAPDAPPELLELVRNLAPPPELRPALRAAIDREIARRTVWHGGWLGPGLGVAVALSVAAGVLYAIVASDTFDEPPEHEAIELRSIPASEMVEPDDVASPPEPTHGQAERERPKPRPRDAVHRNLGQGPVPPQPTSRLDRDAIVRVVSAQRASLGECALRTGIRDGSTVNVSASITIQADGRVGSVSTSSPGPHASAILPCVEAKIRTWVFPRSSAQTQIRMPFLINFPPAPAPNTPADVSAMEPTMDGVTDERRELRDPWDRQAREQREREAREQREREGTTSDLHVRDNLTGDPVTDCAAEGFGEPMHRCIVRTVRPVGQRNLRALAMAHRALGDRANACRAMRLYVDRYGSTGAAGEFRQYLHINCE